MRYSPELVARRNFLDRELNPIGAKDLATLAESIGINIHTIRSWRAGNSNPTLEQIIIVASAINRRSSEGTQKIALRWMDFFKKSSKSIELCLGILRVEDFEHKRVSKSNLLPIIKLLAICGIEDVYVHDLEFILGLQETLQFPLTPEVVVSLLRAKRATAT